MRLRTGVLRIVGAAALLVAGRPEARADLTQTQTKSISSNVVQTNFGPGTPGITDPLVFNQFNTSAGTLSSIDVTLSTSIQSSYIMAFTTPSTITLATSLNPSDPNSGTRVTVDGANGTTPIESTTQAPVTVSRTSANSTFSSFLPPQSPNYLPPTVTSPTTTRTLTPADGALFSQFVGGGTVGLPVVGTASSSFSSSTGNGGGIVLTYAGATVTLTYHYVPEPSSLALLGVGGASLLLIGLRRRRPSLA